MYTPKNREPLSKDQEKSQILQEVVSLVMHSPIMEGAKIKVDGKKSLASVAGKNVDVQTAIAVTMAKQALSGDVKSADWLVKAGGLEPVKEQKITIDVPTFYSNPDDLPEDVKVALAKEVNDAASKASAREEAVTVEFCVVDPEEGTDGH